MNAIRRLGLLVTGTVVVLALGACGAGGEATTAGTVPPVPPIDNPKDAHSTKPCDVLTPQQLNRFGLAAGTPGRNEFGTQCVWPARGAKRLTLTLSTSGGGLTALARSSDPSASRVRLQGYPAVETFTKRGRYCEYDIGIAAHQALIATMTGGKPDSCTALQDVVPAILDHLPPRT